jgi:hypothetical protein
MLEFAKYSNTCWWKYSKQCLREPCHECYLFLTLLKGMLDKPDFAEFEKERMRECLINSLSKNVKLKKIRHRTKQGYKLTKEARNKFLEAIQDVLKTMPPMRGPKND